MSEIRIHITILCELVLPELCRYCFLSVREFTDHAKHGISEEEEWNEALEDYSKKYPEEARNFKELISGELPKDWEKAIPVKSLASSII